MNIFDFVKSINEKTNLGLSQEEIESLYQPWIINRAMSFMPDTILFASMMNKTGFIPKVWQYAFYFYGVPKGRRFGKWQKKDKPEADIELIKNHYNINIMRAEEALNILTDDQLNAIKIMKGGKK